MSLGSNGLLHPQHTSMDAGTQQFIHTSSFSNFSITEHFPGKGPCSRDHRGKSNHKKQENSLRILKNKQTNKKLMSLEAEDLAWLAEGFPNV